MLDHCMACGCTVGACSFGLQMNSLVFSVWGLCCLSMCVHACMGVIHVYIRTSLMKVVEGYRHV